ncbi:hypothetical protein AMS68_003675 [Peltaster fructicola]|uniref:DUF7918 domain-containing protein n=1 Tax=Peltaster fructicola TaxID=286661 RepID=A0A6H0XU66_9PEZI|nr:hypothetical protein AMS68_003675 [Peltaster fructicola]
MPTLRGIECTIELADAPLNEHHTRYRDKYVECYIAAPDSDYSFTIHATSSEYIGEGLSVFVFIDGDYQCNRNVPMPPRTASNVRSSAALTAEFRLRQKEEKLSDGSFVGREWSFAHLVTTKQDAKRNRHYEANVGKVEVIFLRCLYNDSVLASNSNGAAERPVAKASQAHNVRAPTAKTMPAKVVQAMAAPPKIGSMKSAANAVAARSKVGSATAASNAASAGLMGIGELFDGSNDRVSNTKVSSLEAGIIDHSISGSSALSMLLPGPSRTDQLDGSQGDRTYRYLPDGYYQNLYRPKRMLRHDAPQRAWHGEAYRDWSPTSNDHARYLDVVYRRSDQRTQSKAVRIAYVLEERRALKAIGLDPDALIKLIGKDEKVSSIDFARMSPEQIQYLQKAIKRMTRDESDDSSASSGSSDSRDLSESSESSEDRSRPSKKQKKSSKQNGDTTTGVGWGDQPNLNEKQAKKPSKKDRKSKRKKKAEQSSDSSASEKVAEQQSGGQESAASNNEKDNAWPSTGSQSADAAAAPGAWPTGSQKDETPQQQGFTPVTDDKPEQATAGGQQPQPGWRSQKGSNVQQPPQSSSKSSASTFNQRYWSNWDKRATGRTLTSTRLETTPQKARSPYIYSAPALPAVNAASKLNTDRAVKIGRGAAYGHKSARPEYIDTMESPYAVFTFKYCSREKLEQMLRRSIEDDSVGVIQKAEKQKLLSMPKEDLAEELMRLRLAGALPQGQAAATYPKASKKMNSVVKAPTWPTAKDQGSPAEKSAPTEAKAPADNARWVPTPAAGVGATLW